MTGAGFDGRYTNKAGSAAEGSATFYRRSRLRLRAQLDLRMKDVVARLLEQAADGAAGMKATPRHAQLLPLLRASPTLVQALQRVSRCL